MKKYIGFTVVEAEPMSIGEYYRLKNIRYPEDPTFNPNEDGYYFIYPNRHSDWQSKKLFEGAASELDGEMQFEYALGLLKQGCKIKRKLWEQQGITAHVEMSDGTPVMYFNNNNHGIMYTPLTSDIMANDWIIAE